MTAHTPSVFIDETHGGSVCNVSFQSVVGKTETCEIADLLIISISSSDRLRATFWQAKKQGASKWIGSSTGNEQFDFDGQFNQWDLLFRRPMISGVGKFHPPSDLLSSFSSAAIGSFGVFYQRGSLVEVAHSTAEFVACHNPKVKHPKMCINGYLQRYYCAEQEVLVRPTLEGFVTALLDWQIGAMLNPTEPAHRWLAQYVKRKSTGAQLPPEVIRALDNYGGKGDDLTDDNALMLPGDGLSILFVRAASGA